jgi:hypothetical protein
MEWNGGQYRYLLRLVPCAGEGAAALEKVLGDDGWEPVSERVTDDGSDLVVVFRRPS